jgi:hypothetical protein
MGGSILSDDDRNNAKAVVSYVALELTTVRKAAERWQVGLAGLLSAIAAYSVLRSNDKISALKAPWDATAGLLVAAGFVIALLAAILAMQAAFGLPKLRSTVGPTRFADEHSAAVAAAAQLRWAMRSTLLAVVSVFASIVVSWFAQTTGPKVRVVVTGGEKVCGDVVRIDGGTTIVLKTDEGERSFTLATLVGLTAVSKCS